jgi:tRNA threonylcarbamoyl adenosine modification protein YeaZ
VRPFLALDTATDHVAVAIGDLDAPGELLAADDFTARRAANTVLLLAIERLLISADIDPSELAAIACGRGPGSFTGVRIGVATAKGIAQGAHAPLAGFGTADAVAFAADAADGLVGVVGDAMRGEVYPALFRALGATRERLTLDTVVRPDAAATVWSELGEPLTLTGNGLAKHLDEFTEILGTGVRVVDPGRWVPDGPSMIAAAWAEHGDLSVSSIAGLSATDAWASANPSLLLPIYTRLSDAEEAERLRGGGDDAVPSGGVAGPGSGAE